MPTIRKIVNSIVFFIKTFIYIFLLSQIFFISKFYTYQKFEEDLQTHTDAIVVFTGGEKRVCTAVDLFKNDMSSYLYISGVNPKTKKEQVIKAAGCGPINMEGVSIDYAKNTEENVTEVAKWARKQGIRSMRLVTTSFHMPRSLLLLSFEIPDVLIIPHLVKRKNDDDTSIVPFAEFAKFEFEYIYQIVFDRKNNIN